jgi:uncharacterized protein (DUF608 family)
MCLTPSGTVRNAAIGTEPRRFWQRIAHAIDRFMAQRSQRAVSTPVLRQSREDIKRCHRLVSQASTIAVSGGSRPDAPLRRRTNPPNRS